MGEEISLFARIISVVDAYHAMISSRPYRKAFSEFEAQEEFRKEAGSQFDPALVECFLSIQSQKNKILLKKIMPSECIVLN